MKNRSGNAAILKRAVTSALSAVGLKDDEIRFSGNRIELPTCGIVVGPALDNGRRIWKAEGSYSVLRMEDAFESQISSILFTVPLEDDYLLARKLALQVAVTKVDAALDAAMIEGHGRLQR
jgi:hypothetical protein